jgi:hypothetical protein
MLLPVNRLHGCGLSSPEPSKIAGDEGQMFTVAQGMLVFAHASFAPASGHVFWNHLFAGNSFQVTSNQGKK